MTRDTTSHADRLTRLREWLACEGLGGFLLPVTDEYQGEYSADYARRVTWLTGFDGSAGMAIILQDRAFLLVDGRYTLQAAQEVDATQYTIYNSGERSIADCLKDAAPPRPVGYDPWLMTHQQLERLRQAWPEGTLQQVATNPIDGLWAGQPARPCHPIAPHAKEYAGRDFEDKLAEITLSLQAKGVDAFVVTLPDSICWLLNVRGEDVPYNPLALVYAVLSASGACTLFVEEGQVTPEVEAHLGGRVSLHPAQGIAPWLASLSKGKSIGMDAATAPVWFYDTVVANSGKVVWIPDPVIAAKAVKNMAELVGMRRAHAVDGAAVTRFLHWFECKAPANVTELDIVEHLERFRQQHSDYRGGSFATIAGSGPNGAIVHYRADEQSNRTLLSNDILLLDSGGQYPYGTTDITRTVARGEVSEEFRRHFTLVLKGHVALAQARFPEGTSGGQLDALARLPLWQAGLDYDHGTGHGVGAYLCVHEGPQRISKKGSDVALRPGMILSNEPGYYQAGDYGIRIENLVLVVEKASQGERRFLGFETLTLCPIDTRLVDAALLSMEERAWLNEYHARVWGVIAPQLEAEQAEWLRARTLPL
jgi:Xaa-Pro aminopeptidase